MQTTRRIKTYTELFWLPPDNIYFIGIIHTTTNYRILSTYYNLARWQVKRQLFTSFDESDSLAIHIYISCAVAVVNTSITDDS